MILLPTLNRTKLLERFFESFKESEATCPGLVIVDKEDNEQNNDAYAKIWASLPAGWHFKITAGRSMGDKVREVWPDVLAAKPKWVALLNDDHLCGTKGWDKVLSELVDGTNMVSSNDGSHNFGLVPCGITAWSMPLLEAAGFPIFPKNLQHLYIDNVWKTIGQATGCWTETLKIDFPHKHVFWGEMEQDETHKKVYSQTSWAEDSKEFQAFMDNDFQGVCERVLKLRERQLQGEKFT